MNITNSTIPVDQCAGYDTYRRAGAQVTIACNFIIGPICFVLGLFGHSILIRVYSRQVAQGHTAFRYQIFNSTVQICNMFQSIIFTLIYHYWSGQYSNYVEWFVACQPCMWYTAHMVTVISNTLITLGPMFSICTAADRVFALSHPIVYKCIDHRKHQAIAFLICLLFAISTGLFDANRTWVESDGAKFKIVNNLEYMQGLGAILVKVTTAVRVFLLLLLITLNATTVYYFRTKFSAVTKFFQGKTDEKRKQNERTLTLVCICQSIVTSWAVSTILIAYMLIYVAPKAYTCGDVAAYCLYISNWVVRCVDFYVMIVISRQFRSMVIATVPSLGPLLRSRVAPDSAQSAAERERAGGMPNQEVVIG